MNIRNGDFSTMLKYIGILILVGIVCYNWGRYTAKPEIIVKEKIVREITYILPACLEAVCRSIYPVPACKEEAR